MQTTGHLYATTGFRNVSPWSLALAILLAIPGLSCKSDEEDGSDTETANQAITAADQAASEASLFVSALAGIDPSQAPEDLASASAALSSDMEPQDCATTQATGSQVHWTFQDCTGPFGKALLNGEMTVTFRVGPRGTTADVTTSNLTIDDVPVDITATLVIKDSAEGQSLDVTGSVQVETRHFGQMTQTGGFTVTWQDTSSCVTVQGTWNTSFGTMTWRTSAEGLTSCPDSCLTGSVTFEGNARTYDLDFSSNGEVSWSLESGRNGTIQTACGQ